MPIKIDRRRLLHGLSGLAATSVLSGCASAGASSGEPRTNVVRYQGQSGDVVYHELAADLGLLDGVELEWIGNTTSGPQDIQATVTGDTDIGGAFNGAIIRLAAAGAPIKAVVGYYGSDVRTYGGYYALDRSPIRGPRDFIDAKVGVNTLGAHFEDVLAIYLERGGLTEEEIDSVQLVVVPPVSAEQALRSGQLDISALSDIQREKAVAHGGLRPVFSDTDMLGPFTAGCLVMRDEFIARNPDTTSRLVAGIAQAVRWAQTRPHEEVVARYTDIIRRRGRNEDTDSVSYWRSTGIAGAGGLIEDREFSTWLRRLTASGRVPPGSVDLRKLYTNEFNPFRAGAPN
ncbi:ABC transporter substrate-binding protein [Saccharopolyspora gloriosae]|uniref:ABC transporter substrate-binding protein n=1 Tax=Saccharopolyspora gloriosae TaxID=455344 RepID=UPI001FB7B466|nr:ABC transporter substrate-binding protein [Saccharopolyspora gloriosae]